MPISNEALQDPKNNFLAVRGEATIGQAIAALQSQGGQPWWHLVVQMDDGSWGLTRFNDLYRRLGKRADAAEIRLGAWNGLQIATAVEQDSIETRAAEAMARRSSSGVLVVTHGGLPVGTIVADVNRGGASVPAAKLADLGGKYVNLKDYGSILLSSSKK